MTNPNKTLIAALLDRSGSMSTSKKATEDGWHELINDQRNQPGECLITLAQFDLSHTFSISQVELSKESIPEFLYQSVDINKIPPLNLIPRGSTPLLDAVGNFVTKVGEDLSNLSEDDRPGIVVCLIMTDGMENASQEWSWAKVHDLITQQQDQYSWKFIFLGANMDAVATGASIGIQRGSTMTFDSHDYASNVAAYASAGNNITSTRSGLVSEFTEEDRLRAVGKDK